jgi:hypothetical protein
MHHTQNDEQSKGLELQTHKKQAQLKSKGNISRRHLEKMHFPNAKKWSEVFEKEKRRHDD